MQATGRLTGFRILVAEDNQLNQELAVRMLAKLGCAAEVASTGYEAVRLHGAGRCDLTLMDCQMPGLDGLDATRQIRQSEAAALAPRTPIVALSAASADGDRERCLAAGMDDFIAKPLHMQELEALLGKWLLNTPASDISANNAAAQTESVTGDQEPALPKDEFDAVHDLFGSDFAELVLLFLRHSPQRLNALRQAAQGHDCVELARVAHAFAGSCASIGAMRLSALLKQAELLAKTTTVPQDQWHPLLARLDREYADASSKLQALASPGSSVP